MRSLKFLSLIMLCAASSLALILPAAGLVPFPQQLTGVGHPVAETPSGLGGAGFDSVGRSGTFPSNGLPAPFGTPVSTNGAGILPPSLATGNQVLPVTNPGLPGSTLVPGTDLSNPLGLGANRKYDKLGLGLWLLLGPIWLISLLVWTITPVPGGKK